VHSFAVEISNDIVYVRPTQLFFNGRAIVRFPQALACQSQSGCNLLEKAVPFWFQNPTIHDLKYEATTIPERF
jgi:hypothetical protein